MSAEIVPLREGHPSLADVVGQLRQLADHIEAGGFGEVPTLFGWGDVTGSNDPIVQLELAKIWLLTRMTKR